MTNRERVIMRRLIVTALSLSFAVIFLAGEAWPQNAHRKQNGPDWNGFARGLFDAINSQDDPFTSSNRGHEESFDLFAILWQAPATGHGDPLNRLNEIAHVFFPAPWIKENFSENGQDILRRGTAAEYSRYRRHLRNVIRESDLFLKRHWGPYEKARDRERRGEDVSSEDLFPPPILRDQIAAARERRKRARQALRELPAHYIPGFALIWDDGTVVADPDRFIQFQLVREGRSALDAGDGADTD